jgi:hypothetical protein
MVSLGSIPVFIVFEPQTSPETNAPNSPPSRNSLIDVTDWDLAGTFRWELLSVEW